MKKQFTIGEIAKLHNIPESTLRYYDKVGIFQPSYINPDSQYRYYSMEQFSTLDIIKFLRHLDISLHDIKHYIEHRTPEHAIQLLTNQLENLVQQQKEIEYLITTTKKKIAFIHEGLQGDLNNVIYKQLPKRAIKALPLERYISDEEFILLLVELQNTIHSVAPALITNKIGTFVSKKGLLTGRYLDFSGLFIAVEKELEHDNYSYISEGLYACAYHQGAYDDNQHTYDRLLKDIINNGYEVIGDSVEIGIIDYSVTAQEECLITEYQIPVRK